MRHGPDLVVWHCAAEQPCSPPRPPGYLHVYTINRRAHTSEQFSFFRACVVANHGEPSRTHRERASKRVCVRACEGARTERAPPRSRFVAYPLSLQYRRDWHSSGCHPAPFLLRPSPPSAPAHAKTVSSRACTHALARSPGTRAREQKACSRAGHAGSPWQRPSRQGLAFPFPKSPPSSWRPDAQ